MNNIALRQNSKMAEPPPPDLALDELLVTAIREMEISCTNSISERFAPTPTVRRALVMRVSALELALVPAPPEMIAATVTAMLVAFRSAREGEEDAEAIVSLYVYDLADQPLWAITRACEAFRRGTVEGASLDFAPGVPRLLQEVRMQVARQRYELRRIAKVLAAKVVPDPIPIDPAKAIQMAEDCKREIAAAAAARTLDANEKREKRAANERAERAAAMADLESRKARNSLTPAAAEPEAELPPQAEARGAA